MKTDDLVEKLIWVVLGALLMRIYIGFTTF